MLFDLIFLIQCSSIFGCPAVRHHNHYLASELSLIECANKTDILFRASFCWKYKIACYNHGKDNMLRLIPDFGVSFFRTLKRWYRFYSMLFIWYFIVTFTIWSLDNYNVTLKDHSWGNAFIYCIKGFIVLNFIYKPICKIQQIIKILKWAT